MSNALATVQTAYAAFGSGNVTAFLECLAPEVVWEFRGDRQVSYNGRFTGRAQVAEWLGEVARHDGIQAFEPREFFAGDGHVTVLGWERTQALPGGRVFECEWVHLFQVQGGQITRFWGLLDTEAAAAARPPRAA